MTTKQWQHYVNLEDDILSECLIIPKIVIICYGKVRENEDLDLPGG